MEDIKNDEPNYAEEREHYRINDTVEIDHFIIPDNMPSHGVSDAMIESAFFKSQSAQYFKTQLGTIDNA